MVWVEDDICYLQMLLNLNIIVAQRGFDSNYICHVGVMTFVSIDRNKCHIWRFVYKVTLN